MTECTRFARSSTTGGPICRVLTRCLLLTLAAGAYGTPGSPALAAELSLEVLQPVYRQTISATQEEQTALVRGHLSAELAARAQVIRGCRFNAQRHEIATTVCAPQPTADLHFDLATFPPAHYAVEV